MNSREEKENNHAKLCYKCDTLKESKDDIYNYVIWNTRGYGSNFDGSSFTVQICKDCDKPEYETWFNEYPTMNEYVEEYIYEDNILDLIESFPIENQEYVLNDYMDRLDWVDMKQGTLPDEVYKEYGMHSPSEVNAYEENFPSCEFPVNATFHDGSKGCYCPFGASGSVNQVADRNISRECHGCSKYKVRETPIKEMTYETFEKYQYYIKGKEVAHLFE